MNNSDFTSAIDECLKNIVSDSGYPEEFKSVLNYALFPGGKRLRPSLFLAWHSLTDEVNERALKFACGLELFHTFTLIHDDMPCLDNDDYRRGKLSVHKMFGEDKALLAGDALHNLAYKAMLDSTAGIGSTALVLFVSELFGGNGVISGQYDDVFGDCKQVSDVMDIYVRKTAALIYASCVAGCVFPMLSDKSAVNIMSLLYDKNIKDKYPVLYAAMRYGKAFGTAFQLYDDISESLNGEQPDSVSVLDFMSVADAEIKLAELITEAKQSLSELDGDVSVLNDLADRFTVA